MNTPLKEKWLEIVLDDNIPNKQYAFELAKSIKNEIQYELMLWFELNDNFFIKSKIYELLEQKSRKKLSDISSKKKWKGLKNVFDFKLVRLTDDKHLKEAILKYAISKISSPDLSKAICLIRDYKYLSGKSLQESKKIVESFLKEAENNQ